MYASACEFCAIQSPAFDRWLTSIKGSVPHDLLQHFAEIFYSKCFKISWLNFIPDITESSTHRGFRFSGRWEQNRLTAPASQSSRNKQGKNSLSSTSGENPKLGLSVLANRIQKRIKHTGRICTCCCIGKETRTPKLSSEYKILSWRQFGYHRRDLWETNAPLSYVGSTYNAKLARTLILWASDQDHLIYTSKDSPVIIGSNPTGFVSLELQAPYFSHPFLP